MKKESGVYIVKINNNYPTNPKLKHDIAVAFISNEHTLQGPENNGKVCIIRINKHNLITFGMHESFGFYTTEQIQLEKFISYVQPIKPINNDPEYEYIMKVIRDKKSTYGTLKPL